MDNLTPEQRHRCMSRIKNKDTSVEVLLRKALWREGIRYRKNLKTLPGKPDIAITKYKIAVFCDGELWHGKDWKKRKQTIATNRDYWIPKIERNMARDKENLKKLENMGWTVVRFWGMEITKKLAGCVQEVKDIIYEIENEMYTPDCGHDYDAALMAAEHRSKYNKKKK
jgi:DNA mismatch endonuclease (patch repair protein)